MFRSNQFYGHEAILRAYCGGRARLPFVPGIVQHGWMTGDGLGPNHRQGAWPKYLWSTRNLRACQEHDVTDVRPIGAPFLYLPPRSRAPRRSLLAIPFHGWQRQRVLGDTEAYARALETLRTEGFEDITVCLYYVEYEALRGVFESRGIRAVTAGPRDGNPAFLENIQSFLLDHEYVSSNRVCTAAFYALSHGRKFFLFGPPAGLSETDDPTGEQFDAWQRREFPALTFEGFKDRAHIDIGERELGLEYKRSPEALRSAMLWTSKERAQLGRVLAARAVDLSRKSVATLARPLSR